MRRFTPILLTTLLYGYIYTLCPDDDTNLENWSDVATWPNDKLPVDNDNVTISSPVLVDTALPDLFSITIQNGGKLVFSRFDNHDLSVHYILIDDGGEMHIGSEDCQFEKYVTISLLGEPDEPIDIPGFGQKFIGVRENGVLELHGKDKLSWTKVSKTVSQTDPDKLVKFSHLEKDDVMKAPGLNIYRFQKDGTVIDSIHEPISRNQNKVNQAIARLEVFMDGIQNGDVVAIATQGEVIRKASLDLSGLVSKFDEVLGAHSLGDVVKGSAYAYIGILGDDAGVDEDLQFENNKRAHASVTLKLDQFNTRFTVHSVNHKRGRKFADFVVTDVQEEEPIIEVVDDASSWTKGDRVFITSTDYDWKQVEEFTLLDCPQCSVNQIKLNEPIANTHFGEIYKNVDMRAEVGLMSRHIIIQGIVTRGNSNGGHVKFLKGFKSVRVEGVELRGMGQPLVLGRYPLHYHMCGNLSDTSVYPTESYLRRNSIHHTNFRCATIHGTHHAQILDNVCYNTFGHGFFIEDGGEKYTHIEGNLGLGQKSWKGLIGQVGTTGTIPTDKTPVTFWITNPLQILKNNVAAGGDGVGMWFVYPDEPTGPSRNLSLMAEKEARHTPVEEFYNNVAHSYIKAGLFVDNIEQDDLTVKGYNQYDPREVPTDFNSQRVPAIFTRLTAYKNRRQNAWIRGGWMVLRRASLSDSSKGVSMIRENSHYLVFEDSVVIGESPNLGKPQTVKLQGGSKITLPRSVPTSLNEPRLGANFFKGHLAVENVWFDGFKSTQYYQMGALSASKCFFQSAFITQRAKNVQFSFQDSPSTGNRVYVTDGKCDGRPKMSMFTDSDGSVTDITDGSAIKVVRNDPFLVTDQCSFRANWNMAICPYSYGVLEVSYSDKTQKVTLMRTDSPFEEQQLNGDTMKQFFTILGQDVSYLMYISKMPKRVLIRGRGMAPSKDLRFGVCVPRDATMKVMLFKDGKSQKATEVSSLTEVDSDVNGLSYYFDTNVGVAFFKFTSDSDPVVDEIQNCSNKDCPRVILEITAGDLSDSDCSQRFKAQNSYILSSQGTPTTDNSVLTTHSTDPPANWGAGQTYPF